VTYSTKHFAQLGAKFFMRIHVGESFIRFPYFFDPQFPRLKVIRHIIRALLHRYPQGEFRCMSLTIFCPAKIKQSSQIKTKFEVKNKKNIHLIRTGV
jgi:hypothetical protein